MRFGTLLITLLLLGGCATVQWEQQGKTPIQVEEDIFACENTLEKEQNWNKLTAKEKDALREKCMTDKGYRKGPLSP